MRPSRTATRLAVLAGLAAIAAAVPSLPASAADGSSSVKCATGTSCEIQLEHMIHFGGKNYSPGAENTVVDITPPPCLWIPQGDAHTGSQVVIDFYNNTDPGAGALFDGQHAFTEAKQLVVQNPMPAGTWYELPVNPNDTQAQVQQCLNEPLFFWDVPGQALPGIQVPPRTLAQLALAKMNIPQAGRMILSPASGNSYSNLPTFARTTLSFRPEFGPGGMPYVTDNAQLGDQAATVWVRATPLRLSTSDNSARLDTAWLRLPRLEGDGHEPEGGGPHRRQRHRRLRRHLPPARNSEHHRHADLAGLLGGRDQRRPAAGQLQPGPRRRPEPGQLGPQRQHPRDPGRQRRRLTAPRRMRYCQKGDAGRR